MTELTPAADVQPRFPNLLQRMVGVIFSPRTAYGAVAAHPRWLGALVVTVVVSALSHDWFFGTEPGQRAMRDILKQQLQLIERFGGEVPDDTRRQMMDTSGAALSAAVSTAVTTPVFIVIFAGLLMGWFNTIGQGTARFKQLLAVVAHSGVIWIIAGLLGVMVGYFKGELASAGQLSGLFPMLGDTGVLVYFLKFVDLFWIWGLVNLAIGVAVLYGKRTGPIATSFISIYLVVGLIVALVRASL